MVGIPEAWCCVLLSPSYQEAYDIYLFHYYWLSFYHFLKDLSISFLHCKMIVFCLCNWYVFWGRMYWEYVNTLFLIKFSLINFSMSDDSGLKPWYFSRLPNFIRISRHSNARQSFHVHLFIYSCIYLWHYGLLNLISSYVL